MLLNPTLWVPSTDHGGYETEITFEKKLLNEGMKKSDYKKSELFNEISKFVSQNNDSIKEQIKRLGASVDWTRFRFNMDKECLNEVEIIFKKLVKENLILRKPYMVYYCPTCATVLSDIELKEVNSNNPLFYIKFNFIDNPDQYLSLATTRPELIFSVTHVLVHPSDKKNFSLIGKNLINPVTGNIVKIVASKRKPNPQDQNALSPLLQSYVKYDYEYSLLYDTNISAKNLIDWNGKMLERYPGLYPKEARQKEIEYLKENNYMERIDTDHIDSDLWCKSAHQVEPTIIYTWSLDLDKDGMSLKKKALEEINNTPLTVFPEWRKKDLVKWLDTTKQWPIARQNVWGIRIPIWYDISNPQNFTVWFIDNQGNKQVGNLKKILDSGTSINEIKNGLERIYTNDLTSWTTEQKADKAYLPETDVLDTWFSGQWATMFYGNTESDDFKYFYPNHSIVIGYDLVRLSVSREILLNTYLTSQLPYKFVYFHNLINGPDGKKMSKSYGNIITLESFLEKYGSDVTRAALISYSSLKEDFIISPERLNSLTEFTQRLWKMGRIAEIANQFVSENFKNIHTKSNNLIDSLQKTQSRIGYQIEKFAFAYAQSSTLEFLFTLEEFAFSIQGQNNTEENLSIFREAFLRYLIVLHPFMPFITEDLYQKLFKKEGSLSSLSWF
ncbi:MAG: Valine-tRNA ligase [Candidatus Taylorbacteria bacterium]|nr:Valine-tRNA ligase [Candidatus Taylorbacteria bacterium]